MKKAAVLLKKNIEFPIMILVYALFTVLHNFGIINSYIMQVAMLACIYIIVTESLNILNGMTGLSSLGQAGFMSVGAYVSAIITTYVFKASTMARPVQILLQR